MNCTTPAGKLFSRSLTSLRSAEDFFLPLLLLPEEAFVFADHKSTSFFHEAGHSNHVGKGIVSSGPPAEAVLFAVLLAITGCLNNSAKDSRLSVGIPSRGLVEEGKEEGRGGGGREEARETFGRGDEDQESERVTPGVPLLAASLVRRVGGLFFFLVELKLSFSFSTG
mmetsp:Transcript_3131/g.6471  ORF Transcript_3131/g.6471 Transcript_3131/m.6471 type:complete len:168 (-) Transcript_3131:211-714(-)